MNIPILKLRDAEGNIIPVPAIQGEKGEKGNTASVNGVEPDTAGNISLTSDNIPYGNTDQSVTEAIDGKMAATAIVSGLNSNGRWIRFPDGTLIQYGSHYSEGLGSTGTVVLPFPTNFPNMIAKVFVSLISGGVIQKPNLIASVSTSGISAEFGVKFVAAEDGSLYTGAVSFDWFAIGV